MSPRFATKNLLWEDLSPMSFSFGRAALRFRLGLHAVSFKVAAIKSLKKK